MKTMLAVARDWLAAEQQRLAASGETVHTGHPAHIVEWLLEEVQRLRLVICDKISELGEEVQGTPASPSTPGEGTRPTDRT